MNDLYIYIIMILWGHSDLIFQWFPHVYKKFYFNIKSISILDLVDAVRAFGGMK